MSISVKYSCLRALAYLAKRNHSRPPTTKPRLRLRRRAGAVTSLATPDDNSGGPNKQNNTHTWSSRRVRYVIARPQPGDLGVPSGASASRHTADGDAVSQLAELLVVSLSVHQDLILDGRHRRGAGAGPGDQHDGGQMPERARNPCASVSLKHAHPKH